MSAEESIPESELNQPSDDVDLIEPATLILVGGQEIQDVEQDLPESLHDLVDVSEEVEVVYHGHLDDQSIELNDEGNTSQELQANSGSLEVFHGDLSSGRKRRHKAEQKEWRRTKNKEKRMKGQEYFGRVKAGPEEGAGTKFKDKLKGQRTMGETCSSRKCANSKVTFCKDVDESTRKAAFQNFWESMDWGQKKVYVCSLVKSVEIKRKTTTSQSRRQTSRIYYLNVGDRNVKVCQKMFLSTLGLKEKQVRDWVTNSQAGIPAPSPKPAERSQSKGALQLTAFLNELPKMPSHYCRGSSKKLYLEPIYNSKCHLFRIYEAHMNELKISPVSRFKFNQVLDESYVSLFHPKKDQCDVCCSHDVGNLGENEYQIHLSKKDRARSEKSKDKEAAAKGECYVLTVDLESVKVCPMLKASALYYKTKLCVHNYTVYNVVSHDATCYWWHEGEGELVASTFATCLVDYLSECCPLEIPIIIFSDGCTCQNRNFALSNALLAFSMNTNKMVIQKYLEKGHTQMECDSVHSAIESKMKNREIHLPSDYSTICKEARTTQSPYKVKYLSHDFFRNYSERSLVRYDSIRPGKKAGDNVVTDIRALKYEPDGLIYYKLNFDEDWKEMPRRPRNVSTLVFPQLYSARLPITNRKWNDLQDLKSVLPADCHSFYNELPHQ